VTTTFSAMFQRFIEAYEDASVRIPACGLKFIERGEPDLLPDFAQTPNWYESFPRSLASCGFSYKAAKSGWTLRATLETIGCPAGAMSLGLTGAQSRATFDGGCYVKPMERPATPADFSAGYVYAPHQSGHPEFALFGADDCGRYATLEAAQRAVQGMPMIPPVMDAVYYYHPTLSQADVVPDLVHLYLTPLQAMRMIQGYAFTTGERFSMSCIGIRGVSCDMTALPYTEQRMNGTFLCLGARAISGWEEQYVGFGMPYSIFEEVVNGMELSRRGYPYEIFPKDERSLPVLQSEE